MKRLALVAVGFLGVAATGLGLAWAGPRFWPVLCDTTVRIARQVLPKPADHPETESESIRHDDRDDPLIRAARRDSNEARAKFLAMGVATLGVQAALRPDFPPLRLSSPEIAQRMGFVEAKSERKLHAPTLMGNAEIAYNANLYAEVRPRVSGIVREVLADEGTHVHAGDPMIVIDSAEVGTAKADFLAALPTEKLAEQTLNMTLNLRRTNSAPLKEELTAQATFNRARADLLHTRQHLLNLGYTEAELERFAETKETSNFHRVVAPIDGTVVERHAVTGEAVEPTHKLFGVADTRIMWAWIDIYEDAIEDVSAGQPVSLTIFGAENLVFAGNVDWIDTAVNPSTRTVRVRAEMHNPTGRLRAFQFGRAAIRVGEERDIVLIPRDAIQRVHQEEIVFLPLGEGAYEPRRVMTTPSTEPGMIEIVSGLAAGQDVVTTGSLLLKTELLKQCE